MSMTSFGQSELLIAMVQAFGAPRPTSNGLSELYEDLVQAIKGFSGGNFVTVTAPPYNADPTGTTDSTTAFTNAATAAAASGGLGVVWMPPGNYIVNNMTTPAQSTGYLVMAGAGEGAVTLTATQNIFSVIQFRMPGEVRDMTISGGGFATIPLLMRNTSGGASPVWYPISRFAARRVTCTNIAATPQNWLLYMGDALNSANPLVDEIITDDVTLLGPSAAGQDAMTITYGRRYVSRNLRIIGCTRSPNVYSPQSIKMLGVTVELTSAAAAGNSVLVVDSQWANFGQLATAVAAGAPPIWRASRAVTAGAFVQPSAAVTGQAALSGGSGSFTLTWNGTTTPFLSPTATAAQIQQALDALPGGAQIACTGGPLPAAVTVTGLGAASALTASGTGPAIAASGGTGFYWTCLSPGTTGTTEPTWPAAPTNGSVVGDGGASWQWNTGQTVAPVSFFPITNDPRDPRPFTGSCAAFPLGAVLRISTAGGTIPGWTANIAGSTQKPVMAAALAQNATSFTTVPFYPVDGGYSAATLMAAYLPGATTEVTNLEVVDRQFQETGVVSAAGAVDFNAPNVTLTNVKAAGNGIGPLRFNNPAVYNQQVSIASSLLESGLAPNGNTTIRVAGSHLGTRRAGVQHQCVFTQPGITLNLALLGVDSDGGTDGTDPNSPLIFIGGAGGLANVRIRAGSFANITVPLNVGTGVFLPDIRQVVGYNPVGTGFPGTAFALPASGVAWVNATGVDVDIYFNGGGAPTAVTLMGAPFSGGTAIQGPWHVPVNASIAWTYTTAPSLSVIGS